MTSSKNLIFPYFSLISPYLPLFLIVFFPDYPFILNYIPMFSIIFPTPILFFPLVPLISSYFSFSFPLFKFFYFNYFNDDIIKNKDFLWFSFQFFPICYLQLFLRFSHYFSLLFLIFPVIFSYFSIFSPYLFFFPLISILIHCLKLNNGVIKKWDFPFNFALFPFIFLYFPFYPLFLKFFFHIFI